MSWPGYLNLATLYQSKPGKGVPVLPPLCHPYGGPRLGGVGRGAWRSAILYVQSQVEAQSARPSLHLCQWGGVLANTTKAII